jgi:hypothetical protein
MTNSHRFDFYEPPEDAVVCAQPIEDGGTEGSEELEDVQD